MSTLSDFVVSTAHDPAATWMSRQRAYGEADVCPMSAYELIYLVRSVMPPASAFHVQRVAPARPRFVVTTMTPFAASVPYSVAADGPLTISIDSISSGLRSLRRPAV